MSSPTPSAGNGNRTHRTVKLVMAVWWQSQTSTFVELPTAIKGWKNIGNVRKRSLIFEWGMLLTPPKIGGRVSNCEAVGCSERGKEQSGEGFEKSDHYLLIGFFWKEWYKRMRNDCGKQKEGRWVLGNKREGKRRGKGGEMRLGNRSWENFIVDKLFTLSDRHYIVTAWWKCISTLFLKHNIFHLNATCKSINLWTLVVITQPGYLTAGGFYQTIHVTDSWYET